MRKNLLFAFVSIFSLVLAQAGKIDSVLIRINDKPITCSEFKYIYHKNNYGLAVEKKTLDEYVDMFINFKLKVEDAKALGLDTTKAFQNEFLSYREDLIKPYLVDQEAVDFVLREAYERMGEDVEVSHILIRVSPNAMAKDTLRAWNKIQSIKKKLKRQAFDKLARDFSEDESAAENSGYIGWITAFSTVYPFENQAYSTPVSNCSDVFRTNFGYHILKVHNRRASLGSRLTAHIMTFTQEGNDERNKNAKNKIDSLYQKVLSGENFAAIAKEYSEDKPSALRSGELPWFRSGSMIEEFENAAFALKEIGDISPVFQSNYGWHIVKLLDKKTLEPYEKLKPEIETKIKSDARAFRGKEAFAEKLKKEYKLSIVEQSVQDLLHCLQAAENVDATSFAKLTTKGNSLFSFADKTITQNDFIEELSKNGFNASQNGDFALLLRKSLDNFIVATLFEYENNVLETKHDSLRFLLQEFHDGILLFDISSRKVWDRASTDTLGLKKFFAENKSDYLWTKPHYKGCIVLCKDKQTLRKAKRMTKKMPADSILYKLPTLFNDSVKRISVERGLFALGDNEIVDKKIFKQKGELSPNEEFPYFFLVGKRLMYTPDDYSDVINQLMPDYQTELEREWIATLRKKYKVEVDRELLKMIKEY